MSATNAPTKLSQETLITFFDLTAIHLYLYAGDLDIRALDADQKDGMRATLQGLQIFVAKQLAQLPHRSADTL